MPDDAPDAFPRPPLRRRLLVLSLAVTTALGIVLLLLLRPGDPKRDAFNAARAARAAAAASSAASAVGGKAEVMLLPSASTPRR